MSAPRFPLGRSRAGTPASTERPVDVFVRGLLSGALVGAVVAGSAIWERRQRRRLAAGAAGQAGPSRGQAAPDEIVGDPDPAPGVQTTG